MTILHFGTMRVKFGKGGISECQVLISTRNNRQTSIGRKNNDF